MKISTLLFLLLSYSTAFTQRSDNTWCFGDSVKINFNGDTVNLQNPSSVFTYEQSSSISDENGNLLFYIGSCSVLPIALSRIYNATDQLMQNGDSICVNTSITNGSLILPSLSDTNQYYIFYIAYGPGQTVGFTYSIVDMSANGGLGAVIAKNIVINGIGSSFAEKLSACKQGNNDGWWILLHKTSITDSTNLFYKFHLDASGISSPDSQYIGSYYQGAHSIYPDKGTIGEMTFSNEGKKMVAVGYPMIDLFDFDRCTGLLSNWQPLGPSIPSFPQSVFYGCSFSDNSSKLYVSNIAFPNSISQFDLLAVNIIASKIVVYSNINIPEVHLGQHQLAVNKKIYIASEFDSFPTQYDTIYNSTLSCINLPDSLGIACDLQMFSIPLGTGKTTAGLPNNANYYLGTLNCDSANSSNDIDVSSNTALIFPNPSQDIFNLEISCAFERLEIYNPLLENMVTLYGKINRIDLTNFEKGIYFLKIIPLSGKIISQKIIKL